MNEKYTNYGIKYHSAKYNHKYNHNTQLDNVFVLFKGFRQTPVHLQKTQHGITATLHRHTLLFAHFRQLHGIGKLDGIDSTFGSIIIG